MKSKIIRHQWRGTLNGEITQESLNEIQKNGSLAFSDGRITALCIYQWKNMLFVYTESVQPLEETKKLLSPVYPFLRMWPELNGPSPLADMYGIYWHSIPDESWLRERNEKKDRIGRIAFLRPEKLFSYTYWHQAIVQEGLLCGDQYQFISLHENVLFSYFEEPRHNVNLSGRNEPSAVIEGWMKADPESHFDHEIIGTKSNFLVIKPLLII